MADTDRRRAFEALLQTHRKIVFKVAAVYARGEDDRQDLAQEILLQRWYRGSWREHRGNGLRQSSILFSLCKLKELRL